MNLTNWTANKMTTLTYYTTQKQSAEQIAELRRGFKQLYAVDNVVVLLSETTRIQIDTYPMSKAAVEKISAN